MRTKDLLFEIEDISILIQYLYMDENNFIKIPPFNNEMYLDEEFDMKLKIVSTGCVLNYNDSINVNSLLGIVEHLKSVKYDEELHQIKNCDFKNEWDYIKNITLSNLCLNRKHYKRY